MNIDKYKDIEEFCKAKGYVKDKPKIKASDFECLTWNNVNVFGSYFKSIAFIKDDILYSIGKDYNNRKSIYNYYYCSSLEEDLHGTRINCLHPDNNILFPILIRMTSDSVCYKFILKG